MKIASSQWRYKYYVVESVNIHVIKSLNGKEVQGKSMEKKLKVMIHALLKTAITESLELIVWQTNQQIVWD